MGESIAEGTVSKWLKKVGDAVKRDEPIFEISTDKVDAEIPAPAAGVLAEILVHEGTTVSVQAIVARIETEAGAVAAVAAVETAPAGVDASPAANSQPPAVVQPPTASRQPPAVVEPPAAVQPPVSARRPVAAPNSFEERVRTRSSPLVRKMASEHGVDITQLSGTGIAGRVTKRDLLQYMEDGGGAAMRVAPSMHAPGGLRDVSLPLPTPWPGDVVEPMSVMRQKIAERMIVSRRVAAHVTSFMEIDLTRIARIRNKLRASFEAEYGLKLTYLPFIIKASVDALKAYPVLNSTVAESSIIYRKQYNIGVAVALDWGLIVPVIKRADYMSISGITRTLNDLAERARTKKLSPEDVQDGTFTITNPGVFGSLMGTPIISPPQVAILGIGTIEKRPKVLTGADGEDTIAIRTCSYFSISFDHRIIDGAVADQFLSHMKKTLESFPESGV
jgi:2-oxoglutarate dehydrogenase E2 component (dihydrolipoamide succinyltransferase)